jgi:signal transduction histidine kinase
MTNVVSRLLRSPQRLVIGASLLAVLGVAALLVLDVQRGVARDRAVIEAQLRASTRLLEEHALVSLMAAETAMAEVLEVLQRDGLDGFVAEPGHWQAARALVESTPQLGLIALFGVSGQVLFCTCERPVRPLDVRDRDYFHAILNGAERYIGRTISSRVDGRALIPLSRRIEIDGQFSGVIAAFLDAEYFQAFYAKVLSEGPLRLALYRRDGSVLAMQPIPRAGLPLDPLPTIAQHLARHQAHTFLDPHSPIDGTGRIVSFRNLEDYPVAVAVVYDHESVLAGSYPAVVRNAVVFAVFVLATAIGVFLIDRAMRLRLNVERLAAERVVRERFVDMLAHDLRGPLRVGKMNAQLIAGRPQSPARTLALAAEIETSIDRAERMIRNLLDAHRLRAGHRLPLQPARGDLMQIVRDAMDDLPAEDRARLRINGPARLEGWWDADLLRRALWNLMTNAIKYGEPDSPIEVSAACQADAVAITVHNRGPSIPADEQRKLFDPFTRTRSTDVGRRLGWGLGLTLVQGVAKAHAGAVEVRSAPDAGTEFTLRLPVDARGAEG